MCYVGGVDCAALRFGVIILKGSSTTVDASCALSVLCSLACVSIQRSTAYTEDSKQKQSEILQKPAASLGPKAWQEGLVGAHGIRCHRNVHSCTHRYPRTVHLLWEVGPKSVETDLIPSSKVFS